MSTIIDLTMDSDNDAAPGPVVIDLTAEDDTVSHLAPSTQNDSGLCEQPHTEPARQEQSGLDFSCSGWHEDMSITPHHVAEGWETQIVHPVDVAMTSRVGVDLMLAEIGKNHGFKTNVVRKVYTEATSLRETDEILCAMARAGAMDASDDVRELEGEQSADSEKGKAREL